MLRLVVREGQSLRVYDSDDKENGFDIKFQKVRRAGASLTIDAPGNIRFERSDAKVKGSKDAATHK